MATQGATVEMTIDSLTGKGTIVVDDRTIAFVKDDDPRLTDGRPPSGPAGGDLTGTYPDPMIGTNRVTDNQLRKCFNLSVVGNPNNALGNTQDIIAAANGRFLSRHADLLAFDPLVAADIPNIAESQVTGLVSDLSTLASAIALRELLSNKGAASGYASLDGSTLVVQNPASAKVTPTANAIPIASAAGTLAAGWGGAASTLATLNSSALVVENPANATATPTASKIPIADASGKLAAGWGGNASTLATLDGSTLVVQNPANATATPTASKIPIANASGKLAAGWGGAASTLATLNASALVVENPANATATATASKIPIADGSAKLDTWVTAATTGAAGLVKLANHLGGTSALPTVLQFAITTNSTAAAGVTIDGVDVGSNFASYFSTAAYGTMRSCADNADCGAGPSVNVTLPFAYLNQWSYGVQVTPIGSARTVGYDIVDADTFTIYGTGWVNWFTYGRMS